ncbi:MAG: DUF4396 domain-containing protein [Bacteroidota bacterium]
MKQEYFVSGMTCQGCAGTVKKAVITIEGVSAVEVELATGRVGIEAAGAVTLRQVRDALSPWPSYQAAAGSAPGFWSDQTVWSRAGFNTLNCLVGCSIGDFGTIIYVQAFHPGITMATQMVLATIAGLITSVLLETVLLKRREGFSLGQAFRTALSMSFLSMIAMELAMNATDFMITGGKAAFGDPQYWLALLAALVAGFLVPLPYNYYKLKKYNKACH